MECKICRGETVEIFTKKVLNKYSVVYHSCLTCGFVFTDDPYWLPEAYSSAITSLDIGLLSRNNYLQPIVRAIIRFNFNKNSIFLDYAGGYGVFTRLMRDAGFNFYREDFLCENVFAKDFDIADIDKKRNFELVTAFEVFEHLKDPLAEIQKILEFSDNIFFSTELQPNNKSDVEKWWYIVPETGQHIAFYTIESLKIIGEKFGLNLYSNGINLHLLTSKKINRTFFSLLTKRSISVILNKFSRPNASFLPIDFDNILSRLRK